MTIGIEGPTNAIYRLIETTSLIETIGVFEALHDLGLQSTDGRHEAGRRVARVFHASS